MPTPSPLLDFRTVPIPQACRLVRELEGRGLQWVADRAGISLSAMSRFERGLIPLSPRTLLRVVRVLLEGEQDLGRVAPPRPGPKKGAVSGMRPETASPTRKDPTFARPEDSTPPAR